MERAQVGADAPHPSPAFAAAPVVLAGVGVAFGLVPALVAPLVDDALGALGFVEKAPDLGLWHGFTGALGLSAVVILGGVVLFWQRVRVERWQGRLPHIPSALGGYERALRGLLQGADKVAGVVQSGSLPAYLATMLVTLVLVAGTPLALTGGPAQWPDWIDSPEQIVIGTIMVTAAIAATVARRRFAAVLLLGSVGYGMAALFVVQGAPDLALTQLLVETLGVVTFVLVLRHLPDRFDRSARPRRPIIAPVLAVAVGVFVFAFAVIAGSVRARPQPGGFGGGVRGGEGGVVGALARPRR